MTIAIIKFKVKVLGNFSEDTRKLPISGLVAVKARKSLKSQRGGMRKKLKITIYYPRKWIVTQGVGACPPRLKAKPTRPPRLRESNGGQVPGGSVQRRLEDQPFGP